MTAEEFIESQDVGKRIVAAGRYGLPNVQQPIPMFGPPQIGVLRLEEAARQVLETARNLPPESAREAIGKLSKTNKALFDKCITMMKDNEEARKRRQALEQ